jgi:hypothetical protein
MPVIADPCYEKARMFTGIDDISAWRQKEPSAA